MFVPLQITELNEQVNTEGCVSKLHKAFEGYAVIVGAVIGAIIIPVVRDS